MLRSGDVDSGRPRALRAARTALDIGNRMQFGLALQSLALIAELDADLVRAARLWGASTTRAPVWPILEPLYSLRHARDALGERFDAEVAGSANISDEQALSLAIA